MVSRNSANHGNGWYPHAKHLVILLEVTFLEFIVCQLKKKSEISQNFDSPMTIKGTNFQNIYKIGCLTS
jgi:hypothetical protein